MAGPGPMKVGDVGGPVKPTGNISVLGPPIIPQSIPLQTAPPGKPMPLTKPAPQQVARIQPAVQRFANPVQAAPDPEEAALMKELEEELAAPAATSEATASSDDADIDAYIKRFKGTPEELIKQLAKSGVHAEKRMRQVEAEKNLLLKGQPAPVATVPPLVPPVANVPVMSQVTINPFDYKKAGDTLLDNPADRFKEFDEHLTSKAQKMVSEMFTPLYAEALDNRLFRKFPDVVTEENLDVIKAMAFTSEGASDWDKLTNAVKKYSQGTNPHGTPGMTDQDVEKMKLAAQQPTPQAKTGGAKMWKQSELRKIMQRRDYANDPKWRVLVDKAYAENRVLRDQ